MVSIIGVTIPPNSAQAINLIGSLLPTNYDGFTDTNSNVVKAVAFTLPSGDNYTLDDVVLRLVNYSPSAIPLVQIRNDGGTAPGGTVIATLNNPTGLEARVFDYTFAPSHSVTFSENTRYWLYVTATASGFQWRALSSGVTPTGIATLPDYRLSTNGGSTFSSSDSLNSFQINATPVAQPVPKPVTILGTLLAGALGVAFKRKSL